jgi:hypothetical protein
MMMFELDDDFEKALEENNYPVFYILEEGETAKDAFKKMMAMDKLIPLKEDLPKVMDILNDEIFCAINTEQAIYDKMVQQCFGIPKQQKR